MALTTYPNLAQRYKKGVAAPPLSAPYPHGRLQDELQFGPLIIIIIDQLHGLVVRVSDY